MRIQRVLQRILSEFTAAPDLRLTACQAQQRWNLDGGTCDGVLAALVDARFLARQPDGMFISRQGALPGLAPDRTLTLTH